MNEGDNSSGSSKPKTIISLCPYSIYSLQFFLLLTLAKASRSCGMPTLVGYALALTLPSLILSCLFKKFSTNESFKLVLHSLKTSSDHPHSRATTLSVILQSAILGVVFYIGLSFIDGHLESHFVPLGFYLILLATFHFSEFFVTSLTNPSTLTPSSFLIDQSSAYVVAISCSFAEFLIEAYLIPDFKKFNVISMLGLVLAVCGEFVRKLAMFTAGKNFSHFISVTKNSEHKLVTHGIYNFSRHPSYAGWFYWAIGTQVMLLNPFCLVLFAVISYKFFKDRIMYEEDLLVEFFGKEYIDYRRRVKLWMPLSIQH